MPTTRVLMMMIFVAGLNGHLVTQVQDREAKSPTGTGQSSPSGQQPSAPDPTSERIRQKVQAIGVARKITVILKDGTERYGTVAAISPDAFQIIEVDLKQELEFRYDEVGKVRKDYGRKHTLTGKRVNPLWGRVVGAALLGTFAIIIGVGVGD